MWRLGIGISSAVVVAALSACGGNAVSRGSGEPSAASGGAASNGYSGSSQLEPVAGGGGTRPNDAAPADSAGAPPWDPFAAVPVALGPVQGPAVSVPENCCSRRNGPSPACPEGATVAVWGTLAQAGDTVALMGTLATVGVDFQVTALAAPATGPVVIALVESAVPPPAGVADASPVYLVEAEATLPALAVKVPMASNQSQFAANSTGLYFSADGSSFTQIADSYQNAGFLQGTIPGAGIVFAGSRPSPGDCR
jgi:hypothetical protein